MKHGIIFIQTDDTFACPTLIKSKRIVIWLLKIQWNKKMLQLSCGILSEASNSFMKRSNCHAMHKLSAKNSVFSHLDLYCSKTTRKL